MIDVYNGLLTDAQAAIDIATGAPGAPVSMRTHAMTQLCELSLADDDWMRLLALARVMVLIPTRAEPAAEQEGRQ